MLKKPSRDDVEAMVVSHERALFGYTDRDSLKIVPGLLARIDQAHTAIGEISGRLSVVQSQLQGVPELVENSKKVKKYGAYGTGAIIVLLLSIVFHQYGLITAFFNWIH